MDDLEATIRDLIARKNALPEESAEYQLVVRELTGLRYSYEDAGPIIEELDPFGWGGATSPLPTLAAPEGRVIPLSHTSGSRRAPSRA